MLHAAICQPSKAEAAKLLNDAKADLGEYGFVFQIAVDTLLGEHGWDTLCDILDRLFGKPKGQSEVNLSGSVEGIKIVIEDCDGKDKEKR